MENEFTEVYIVGKTVSGRITTIACWLFIEILQKLESEKEYDGHVSNLKFNLN